MSSESPLKRETTETFTQLTLYVKLLQSLRLMYRFYGKGLNYFIYPIYFRHLFVKSVGLTVIPYF